METHQITLHAIERGHAEARLPDLEQELREGVVGTLDAAGMLEIELPAETREHALERIRDALATIGAEEWFSFPATTGTQHRAVS